MKVGRPKIQDGLTHSQRYRKNNPGASAESSRRWRKAHPKRAKKVVKNFHKNNPHYLANKRSVRVAPLLKEQRGLCAICQRKMHHPYEDHDHRHCVNTHGGCPKCRRGLLCPSCNGGLHMFDNKKIFKAAIAYLKKWETQWIRRNT